MLNNLWKKGHLFNQDTSCGPSSVHNRDSPLYFTLESWEWGKPLGSHTSEWSQIGTHERQDLGWPQYIFIVWKVLMWAVPSSTTNHQLQHGVWNTTLKLNSLPDRKLVTCTHRKSAKSQCKQPNLFLSTMLCPVDNHNNELQHPHSQYYNYYTYIQHLNYLSYHKNCKEHTVMKTVTTWIAYLQLFGNFSMDIISSVEVILVNEVSVAWNSSWTSGSRENLAQCSHCEKTQPRGRGMGPHTIGGSVHLVNL